MENFFLPFFLLIWEGGEEETEEPTLPKPLCATKYWYIPITPSAVTGAALSIFFSESPLPLTRPFGPVAQIFSQSSVLIKAGDFKTQDPGFGQSQGQLCSRNDSVNCQGVRLQRATNVTEMVQREVMSPKDLFNFPVEFGLAHEEKGRWKWNHGRIGVRDRLSGDLIGLR